MAAYDPEEREQIDELKAWWERYGSAITAGLILGLLVIAGVQGWRWWNGKRAEDASVLYTAVSDAVRAKDAAKAKDAALSITDRYGSTAYAPRAALLYAKLLYDTGDRSGAKAHDQADLGLLNASLGVGAVGIALHVAAMLAVMGVVAIVVYERLGLKVLRTAWLNTDRLWAAAFVLAAFITLLS